MESTSRLNETYQERQSRRDAYLAGMEQWTVPFVPRRVSQAAACDGNVNQIPAQVNLTYPPPGVLLI